jgi:hypothetical protein
MKLPVFSCDIVFVIIEKKPALIKRRLYDELTRL